MLTFIIGAYRVKHEDIALLKTSEHKSGALLAWWRDQSLELPIMSRAVKSVLAIPAASSMSENNFSDAGNTVTAKRNALKPATLEFVLMQTLAKRIIAIVFFLNLQKQGIIQRFRVPWGKFVLWVG